MRHIMSDSANHCGSVCLAFESRQDISKPHHRSREHDTRGRGNEKNCMFKIPHPYTAACSCLGFPSRFWHEFLLALGTPWSVDAWHPSLERYLYYSVITLTTRRTAHDS